MKIVLVLFFLEFTLFSNAQLTRGQVYNFEVGDVHHKKGIYIASGSGGSTTEADTIIYKSFSTGLDSITYHIKRKTYDLSSSSGWTLSITESVDTVVITNLSQPASHLSASSCLPVTDTSFSNGCGMYVERKISNYDTSCFEPEVWHSDLIPGLGGPYYDKSSVVNGIDVSWELIYSTNISIWSLWHSSDLREPQ